MKLKGVILLIVIAILPLSALSRPMITDLDERIIKINAKFAGKELLLYGARVEAGNIVVVVRGPVGDYIVRKKENIGGVWVNTSSVEFKNVPQFYRLASTAPLEKLNATPLLKQMGIGFDTIKLGAKPSSKKIKVSEFEKALEKKLHQDDLLNFEVINLPFLEGTLFRVYIDFPPKISDGIYTAEIYSFNDGQLQGIQSIPILAKKTGTEAFIYNAGHKYPAIYAIIAVLLAVVAGLIAAKFFRKA